MVYEFSIIEGGIALGPDELNISLRFGVDAPDFMSYYESLRENFGMKINEVHFDEVREVDGEERRVRVPAIYEYSKFILFTKTLDSLGVDINNLVRQIKPCKDYREICHARGLAELGYVYNRDGCEIEFLHGPGPDLLINGYQADLKVAQHHLLAKYRREPKVSKDRVDLPYELLYEITQNIRTRLQEVLGKVDVLFFDLSGARFFSAMGLLVEGFSRVVPLEKHRLVFFNTHYYPPSIPVYKKNNENISTFIGSFPDIFSFVGFYIDFDSLLWSSISEIENLVSKIRN
jgi:hypothetical protein